MTIGLDTLYSKSFSLSQSYNGHHTFDLHISVPEDQQLDVNNIDKYLGKKVGLHIENDASDSKKSSTLKFEGFIDSIYPSWGVGMRSLRMCGFSYSILLDNIPHYRCFVDVTLNEIIKEIWSQQNRYPDLKTSEGDTAFKYVFQAQETDYQFLCRICDQKGLLCVFNGVEFIIIKSIDFGKYNERETLTIGKKLNNIDMSINVSPITFSMTAYNYCTGQKITKQSKNLQSQKGLTDMIVNKSEAVYPDQQMVQNALIDTEEDLKNEVNKVLGQQSQNMIRVHANTKDHTLKIGQGFIVKDRKDINKNELFEQAEYVIVNISHSVSNDGSYSNNITALPLGFDLPFRMNNYRQPDIGPVTAIVTNTKDPKSMGRVAVRFINDQYKDAKELTWLRVLYSYTGNGGSFFSPEVDDHVLVYYEGNNIENQPFVMGSFYQHAQTAGLWSDNGKDIKGFSAHQVSFKINNKGTLKIEAEQIELIARQNMKINGGNQLTQKAARIDLN